MREPFLHFFVLGAVLFLVYAWLNRGGFDSPDEIVVDAARVTSLGSQFERVWQRPPTADELSGLIDGWVREEILYREGVALGLDQDDPVLRRRVAQKVLFMSDALVDDAFGQAELEAWFTDNAERYRIEPRYSFRQVYLDPSRRDEHELDGLLAHLGNTLTTAESSATSDSSLLPASLERAHPAEIRRTFGAVFSEALAGVEPGEWHGPLTSAFGLHFVFVTDSSPGRIPSLDEVRESVERDLLGERTRQAGDAFYEALRERYSVHIEDDVAHVLSGELGDIRP